MIDVYEVVSNQSAKDLLEMAVRNAGRNSMGKSKRWVKVMDLFSLGSTSANELCEAMGFDPDKVVGRNYCDECEWTGGDNPETKATAIAEAIQQQEGE